MAISVLGERVSGSINNGSGASQAFDLESGCSAGNTLILAFACRDTSASGFSVSDERGNTWTIDIGPFNTANNLVFVASTRQNAGTLQTGDTITVTMGTAAQQVRIWNAIEVSGLVTSSYVDKTANAGSATGVTSFPSGTTAATTQNDELAVAAFCLAVDLLTINKDANYSWFGTSYIEQAALSDGYDKTLAAIYRVLSSTGTQSATCTASAGVSYQGVIATYKASVSGSATVTASPASASAAVLVPSVSAGAGGTRKKKRMLRGLGC